MLIGVSKVSSLDNTEEPMSAMLLLLEMRVGGRGLEVGVAGRIGRGLEVGVGEEKGEA